MPFFKFWIYTLRFDAGVGGEAFQIELDVAVGLI